MARPDSFETIYLDSCALIAVIMGEAGCQPIKDVLRLADQRQLRVFGSPLTLVEARGQGRGQRDPEVDRRAKAILAGARIVEVDLSRSVALRARDLVGEHGLKPVDAIHLASAAAAGVEVFWTLDEGFKRLCGTRVDGVWVDKPYEFGQAEFTYGDTPESGS